MDVLAQFQLGHHSTWRRTAQSSHQHLPRPRFLCSHCGGHLQHVSEKRKTGHGNAMSLKNNKSTTNHLCISYFLMTNMLFYLTGAYPECHSGRWCCHGNSSRVHDHSLWFTNRGFLLWHHLHLWLRVCHGETAVFHLLTFNLREHLNTGNGNFKKRGIKNCKMKPSVMGCITGK